MQFWPTYRKKFSADALASGWQEEEEASESILALPGDALETLCTLIDGEMLYCYQPLQQVNQMRLKNKQQMPGETLQQHDYNVVPFGSLYLQIPRLTLICTVLLAPTIFPNFY